MSISLVDEANDLSPEASASHSEPSAPSETPTSLPVDLAMAFESAAARDADIVGRLGRLQHDVQRVLDASVGQSMRTLLLDLTYLHDGLRLLRDRAATAGDGGIISHAAALLAELEELFARQDVVELPFDTLHGEPFDAQRHRMICQVESVTAVKEVWAAEVRRPGFTWGSLILRPAQVAVLRPRP